MGIFYTRQETQKEVVITWKYLPLYYLSLIAFLFLAFFFNDIYSFALLILFFVVTVVDFVKPNREIKKAMKAGSVRMSGQKFSFSNPLKATIEK